MNLASMCGYKNKGIISMEQYCGFKIYAKFNFNEKRNENNENTFDMYINIFFKILFHTIIYCSYNSTYIFFLWFKALMSGHELEGAYIDIVPSECVFPM